MHQHRAEEEHFVADFVSSHLRFQVFALNVRPQSSEKSLPAQIADVNRWDAKQPTGSHIESYS